MTIAAVMQEWPIASAPHTVIVSWTGLSAPGVGASPDGQWLALPDFTLIAISVTGTFGAGGSVAIRASNGQADESTILGPYASAGGVTDLSITAGALRPLVTGGDTTTNLTVTAQFQQQV